MSATPTYADHVPAAPDLDSALAEAAVEFTTRIVDLNLLRVGLRSNLPDFAGFDFFTRFREAGDPGDSVDFWVDCIDLDRSPVAEATLRALADDTFRAKRFRSGFYLTSYFGSPAWLVTRGNRFAVFGRGLERTVWPYFVKHILTAYAADHGLLHLKAAGVTDAAGRVSLLFGRGGAGKTVLLSRACAEGMRFLSNTHVLVKEGTAYGIPSAMRVREDAFFGPLIRRQGLAAHLEEGEFMADPAQLFGSAEDSGHVTNLCVVDFRPDRPFGIRPLDDEDAYDFLEQFSFAVSAYGLKDDLLAHHAGDFAPYVDSYRRMKQSLRELVTTSRAFHINMDMEDKVMREAVLVELSGSSPAITESGRLQ